MWTRVVEWVYWHLSGSRLVLAIFIDTESLLETSSR